MNIKSTVITATIVVSTTLSSLAFEPTWLPGGDDVKAAVAARRGQTELSRLALSMEPGTWAELDAGGPGILNMSGEDGGGLDIMTWSDDAHWDSRTGQFFYMGLRQRRRFIAYSETENAWRNIPLSEDWEAENSPPTTDRYGHQYSRNALDPETSRFYTMARDNIYRYDIRANTWTNLPPGGSYRGTGLIEFFGARNGLINISDARSPRRNHQLFFFSKTSQTWENLGRIPIHGHHAMGRHNPYRREVLLGGSNNTIRNVVRVKEDGSVERLQDAPLNLSITRTWITVDPASGRYLVLIADRDVGRRLFELDSEKNQWRLVDDFSETDWPFRRREAPVVAYIPEYGVSIWASRHTYLYKHNPDGDYPIVEPETDNDKN